MLWDTNLWAIPMAKKIAYLVNREKYDSKSVEIYIYSNIFKNWLLVKCQANKQANQHSHLSWPKRGLNRRIFLSRWDLGDLCIIFKCPGSLQLVLKFYLCRVNKAQLRSFAAITFLDFSKSLSFCMFIANFSFDCRAEIMEIPCLCESSPSFCRHCQVYYHDLLEIAHDHRSSDVGMMKFLISVAFI